MSMKEYALQYQKLGFSVIPINPKQNAVDWFADKTSDVRKAKLKTLGRLPNANAIRTTNFFVIDIDTR